jgi:fluoride ion exporter CrcB/FEX
MNPLATPHGSDSMALAKKALGALILSKFFQQPRVPWYRRNTLARRPALGFLIGLTPLSRFSLGGIALLAARRFMARRQLPA